MQILIYGAGAIGSFLGHRLLTAGHDVTLVLRAQQARTIQSQGLRVQEGDEVQVSHPRVAERIADLEPRGIWDCVMLTVKAFDTAEALTSVAPLVDESVPVVVVQNGVGGEELAAKLLPPRAIISAVITLSVSVRENGSLCLETRRGGLSLAPYEVGRDVTWLARAFATAHVRTTLCADYRAQKWSKLCLNIMANAVPAILDLSPGQVYSEPSLFGIERAAFVEALTVMHALRIGTVGLPGYPVPLLAWAISSLPQGLLRPLLKKMVASGRGEKRPSLQLDLSAGRRQSEVAYLNGAVAGHSERLGLKAPVNRVLTDTLIGIVDGRIAPNEFRGNPERLLTAISNASGG